MKKMLGVFGGMVATIWIAGYLTSFDIPWVTGAALVSGVVICLGLMAVGIAMLD